MFEKLKKWLRGEYVCIRCGKTWHSEFCGFGHIICPECYTHKDVSKWMFPDKGFFLNR